MTKGWLLPLATLLLLPVFCRNVLVWVPVRPVRSGALFGFMRLLRLLMLISGVPPWSGKKLLFGWEKGMPLISVRAMIPATILFDGWVPPRMSCMKKDNGGEVVAVVVCEPAGFATVALVATNGAGPLGGVVVVMGPAGSGAATLTGEATGAVPSSTGVTASATGAATAVSGTTVSSGSGGSASPSSTVEGVVAWNWPLGNVVVGAGTAVVAGGPTTAGYSGSTPSRILAELAQERVIAIKKKQTIALSDVVVTKRSLAILGFDSVKELSIAQED